MSSGNTTVLLIAYAALALVTTCRGGDISDRNEDQILSTLISTQPPRVRTNPFMSGPEDDEPNEKVANKVTANQLIPRPLLTSKSYLNLTPVKRRRRYQRMSPLSVSRSQWLASIHPQSHNQRITSNNLDNIDNTNIDIKNNHLNNELSDENSNSLLPSRHIRRPKQSSNSGTKSSKSSQQMSIKPMATVSRGTRGARQYDIPQIGESIRRLSVLLLTHAIHCMIALAIIDRCGGHTFVDV